MPELDDDCKDMIREIDADINGTYLRIRAGQLTVADVAAELEAVRRKIAARLS